MEFFVPPAEGPRWYEYWKDERRRWYEDLGIRPDHLTLREHEPDELSHYSSRHRRRRVPLPDRVVGARGHRQPHRLRPQGPRRALRREARVLRPGRRGERYVPHVIEPAAGADRATLAFLVDAYDEEEVEGEKRTVLKLHPRLAPVKVAVLPLVRKDGQPELAREVFDVAQRPRAGRVRRGRLDRQALPPPGRDRHAVLRDDRPPVARGPHGHASATATRSAQERVAIDALPRARRGEARRAVAVAEAGRLASTLRAWLPRPCRSPRRRSRSTTTTSTRAGRRATGARPRSTSRRTASTGTSG